jgi:heme O synthase-like polyprenyltransferase
MVPYEYIYISLIISVIFFIWKQFLYRSNPIKNQNKLFFKDSFYLFLIILGVFIIKDYYMKVQEQKTQIFTGEPSF